MVETSLLGPCNYYCGNCIVYRKSRCLGCAEATEKAKAEGRVFCAISVCTRDKKLETCSDCESHPCEKYDKSIFAESFIKWVRAKLQDA